MAERDGDSDKKAPAAPDLLGTLSGGFAPGLPGKAAAASPAGAAPVTAPALRSESPPRAPLESLQKTLRDFVLPPNAPAEPSLKTLVELAPPQGMVPLPRDPEHIRNERSAPTVRGATSGNVAQPQMPEGSPLVSPGQPGEFAKTLLDLRPPVAPPTLARTWIDFSPPDFSADQGGADLMKTSPVLTKPRLAPPGRAPALPATSPIKTLIDVPSVQATNDPALRAVLDSAPPTIKKGRDSYPAPNSPNLPPQSPMLPDARLGSPGAQTDSSPWGVQPSHPLAQKFFAKDDDRRWLDRYELIAEIASGGMATVYLGRIVGDGGFQRLVAIKRIHDQLAEDPEIINMFRKEARIAAQIHHAHVVPILEIGMSKRGHYLVMEYIEGMTLAQISSRVVASGLQIPRRFALRMVLDTLAGLHAAHDLTGPDGKILGIVHRDCSPHNILVGVDGNARITDFGVARDTSAASHTRAGTLKGKVAYMAPEQIKQDMRLDRRADLFAMGVVLWEALAGRTLFRADTRWDTILAALSAPVPRLAEVTYGIPPALDDVCAKALERDPSRRFQTAVQMAEAIEQAGGTIAQARDVAAFLRNLFGREFNDRRTAIRNWLDAAPEDEEAVTTLFTQPSAPESGPVPVSTAVPMGVEGPVSKKPDSAVTTTRQLVGSLEPIPLEEHQAAEALAADFQSSEPFIAPMLAPMSTQVVSSVPPATAPAPRAPSPVRRESYRWPIVLIVIVAFLIVGALVFLRFGRARGVSSVARPASAALAPTAAPLTPQP